LKKSGVVQYGHIDSSLFVTLLSLISSTPFYNTF